MRRWLAIFVAAVLLPAAAVAQTATFDALYAKYSGLQGVESGKVGKMMLLAARAAGQGDKIPEGMEGLRALTVKDRGAMKAGMAEAFEKDIRSVVSASGYALLGELTKEGYTMRTYARPCADKSRMKDPVIYVTGGTLISVTQLTGELSRNDKSLRGLIKSE